MTSTKDSLTTQLCKVLYTDWLQIEVPDLLEWSSQLQNITETIDRGQFDEARKEFCELPDFLKSSQAQILLQIKFYIVRGFFEQNCPNDAQSFLSKIESSGLNTFIQNIAILVACNKFEEAMTKCEEFTQKLAAKYGRRPWAIYSKDLSLLYDVVYQIKDQKKLEQLLEKIRLFGFSHEIKKNPADVELLRKLNKSQYYPEAYSVILLLSEFSSELNKKERNQVRQAIQITFTKLIREQTTDGQKQRLEKESRYYLKIFQDLPDPALEFERFMALIKENKIEEALSCANNIGSFDPSSNFSPKDVCEKVRACATHQVKDPYVAFKLLNIIQKWQLDSLCSMPLQNPLDFSFQLRLLESLAQGGHFCEFLELLSYLHSKAIPESYKLNFSVANARSFHDLLKNNCQEISLKAREILRLQLPLPQEIKKQLQKKISDIENSKERLRKEEEEQKRLVNDVFSEYFQEHRQMKESLRKMAERVKTAEERYTTQKATFQQMSDENEKLRTQAKEIQASLQGQSEYLRACTQAIQEINPRFENEIAPLKDSFRTFQNQVHKNELQRQNQYHHLNEQLNQLSSSMNKMDGKCQEQFEQFKQRFESLISAEVSQQTVRIQNQIYGLQRFYVTLDAQIKENQLQTYECERICSEVLKEIHHLSPAVRNQSQMERRTAVSPQKNLEGIFQAFQEQKLESEKIMKLLRMNLQQNFKVSESQDSSQAFSIKRPEPQQQEEEKTQDWEPKEKYHDEREELDFDQQENEERKKQISESTLQQFDRENEPSIEEINSNYWESLDSDQD